MSFVIGDSVSKGMHHEFIGIPCSPVSRPSGPGRVIYDDPALSMDLDPEVQGKPMNSWGIHFEAECSGFSKKDAVQRTWIC